MRSVALIALLSAASATVVTGCNRTKPPIQNDAALSDTLKAVIAEAYDFTKPDAVQRMYGLYRTQGRVVSASGGQLMVERDSIRKGLDAFWQNVGTNMKQPHWEWGDVYVQRLGMNAAVLTGTWSIPHIAPTNQPHVIRGAWTAVFQREAGKWRITQEHLSSAPSSSGP